MDGIHWCNFSYWIVSGDKVRAIPLAPKRSAAESVVSHLCNMHYIVEQRKLYCMWHGCPFHGHTVFIIPLVCMDYIRVLRLSCWIGHQVAIIACHLVVVLYVCSVRCMTTLGVVSYTAVSYYTCRLAVLHNWVLQRLLRVFCPRLRSQHRQKQRRFSDVFNK